MAGETIGMAIIEGIQGIPIMMVQFLTLCIENGKADIIFIAPSILKIVLTIIAAICICFTIKVILNKIYRWWRQP